MRIRDWVLKEPMQEKDGFRLYAPCNTQDMNYHLVDVKDDIEYLIDIGDIYSKDVEGYKDEGIEWDTFYYLKDIEAIKEAAWKVIGGDSDDSI